ncbi:tyramine beta-hydroxylase-like [Biomphalaria glabrata]|uniref:Tyramine beta-hydroxylase-like n=1 Tax=Biomphalaria glabrata TaxID=6526 RepID=A0A9W2YI22_BIOGL|nr:tyramine beta-hydroxylase-like [Biomphalaria glabrata]
MFRFLFVVLFAPGALAYRSFKSKIPNGDAVPHPCKANTLWEGVGHFIEGGTGPRNPFGVDFAAENFAWTITLCRKDSDGDGRTNGQELGDPNCTWTENTIPTQTSGISHPGICDPWDSPTCLLKNVTHGVYKTQGDWLRAVCKAGDFVCPGKNESGVKNAALHVPTNTTVPPKQTTYMCQMFNLETLLQNGTYHMVAVEPIIGNVDVLHHMVLFGCEDSQEMINGPYECGMVASPSCQMFISVWTVGLAGDCAHPLAGIKLGQGGYKKIAIQLHWNNPSKRSDWVDSSGMRIYYTPHLRTYDAGIIVAGAQGFVLPPRRASITITSTCTSGCTRNLIKAPINVTMAWNHMHYAGVQMSIEVKRNNVHYLYMTNDPVYSYDSPQVYTYTSQPIQLLPGDEVTTRCTYTTANRNSSTLFGEGTYDEMCYGFISYYPKDNFWGGYCLSGGQDISYCDQQQMNDLGCPTMMYYFSEQYVNGSLEYRGLVQNCQSFSPCLEECVQYVAQLTQSNACFKGDVFEFIKNDMLMSHQVGRDLMARMASCQTQVYALLHPTPTTGYPQPTTLKYTDTDLGSGPFATASLTTATSFVILLAIFGLLM